MAWFWQKEKGPDGGIATSLLIESTRGIGGIFTEIGELREEIRRLRTLVTVVYKRETKVLAAIESLSKVKGDKNKN